MRVMLEIENGLCVIRLGQMPVGRCREGNVLVHRGASFETPESILAATRDARLNQFGEGVIVISNAL